MPFVRKARPLKDPNLRKPNAGLTKYEKEIYDVYSKAFDDVRNQLGDQKVLNDILEALRANSASKVPSALNWRAFIESLDKTAPTLSKQIAAMANLHSKNLPRKIRYEYNFESKDPRAIAWAQTQAGKRIQGITLETQQAISNLISDGLRTKLTREEIIAELRQTVGLDKRQSRALGTFYEKRLNKYLEDGMTYEEAAKKAEKEGNKYRVRLVKQRAIRIARTEISAATNAGRYLSWIEADERDLLPAGTTKRWITARDERTCPVCAPMNGFEIAWTIPFSTGDQMPPAHPNCRCTAVIVPAEAPVLKHLQGKHNQKAHGKSGSVAFSEMASSTSNFLNMSDNKGNLLAYVSYVKSYQIEIDMIRSYQENKGYATKVVDELYQRFPNKTISWGKTIEPASTHLAQKFSDKYGRTSFIPWGNGVIEGYEWGQEYGDLMAKVAKHAPGKHNQQSHAGGKTGGGKVYDDLKDFIRDQASEHPTNSQAYDEKIDEITLSQTGPNGELLATENRAAVLAYQGNIGHKINEALRDPQISEAGYQKYIDGLDKTIELAPPLSQKITVYRGVQSNVGRDNEFWRRMEVGDVIEDKGFVSTTLRPSLAADFAYKNDPIASQGFVFKMDLPVGTKGVFPSSVLGLEGGVTRTEAEFLLPRGSKFEILSKEGKVWELGLVND